jgi:hypothetical protein
MRGIEKIDDDLRDAIRRLGEELEYLNVAMEEANAKIDKLANTVLALTVGIVVLVAVAYFSGAELLKCWGMMAQQTTPSLTSSLHTQASR